MYVRQAIELRVLLLGRVALVRGVAGCHHQTPPWTICRSACRSVRRCVGLSSALWKNGGSDPDAVWHRRSDGSRDEAGGGVWGSAHGKGYFGANLGRAIVTNGDLLSQRCGSSVIQAWSWRPTGFLQCFDTVGLVIWPVKIVPEMTYYVSSGTLNPTYSLTLAATRPSSQITCYYNVRSLYC